MRRYDGKIFPGWAIYTHYRASLEDLIVWGSEHERQRRVDFRKSLFAGGGAVRLIQQCVEGLAAHHQFDVLVCDIKPNNIWINTPFESKTLVSYVELPFRCLFGDYGESIVRLPSSRLFSHQLRPSDIGQQPPSTTEGTGAVWTTGALELWGLYDCPNAVHGTPAYVPPEAHKTQTGRFYGTFSEVYALGLTLLESISGHNLHQHYDETNRIASIAKFKDVCRISLESILPRYCVDILLAMTNIAPNRRPSVSSILNMMAHGALCRRPVDTVRSCPSSLKRRRQQSPPPLRASSAASSSKKRRMNPVLRITAKNQSSKKSLAAADEVDGQESEESNGSSDDSSDSSEDGSESDADVPHEPANIREERDEHEVGEVARSLSHSVHSPEF
jgi:serine/threonine protein kinase